MRRGFRQWLRRGTLAIADQGLMSGSNFALTILLARWLSPQQYGAYALALSIFFFAAAAHQALLLEPLSVLGPADYAGRSREYLGALLWFHAACSVILAIVFAATGWIFALAGSQSIALALLALACGAPGTLLYWLARTACYVEFAPAAAAGGGLLYSVTLLGGAWMLSHGGLLSTFTAIALMGGAGAFTAIVILAIIRPVLRSSRSLLRDVAGRHWGYGRWALGSTLVLWVPGNIFYSITAAIGGVSAAGAFRALMNLTFPVTHSASALSMLFQPWLSRKAARDGATATTKPVARILALYGAGALTWTAIVALATKQVWQLLYRGRYENASGLAVLALIGVVFQVAAYAPAVGLRALQMPATIFRAYSIAAAAALIGGIPATRIWGLAGAVASYSCVLLLSFAATMILYRRKVRGVREDRSAMPTVLAAEAP